MNSKNWTMLTASVCLLFGVARGVWAHPMGNFAICHYARLEAAGDGLHLRYVLDLAEIPTVTAKQELDANHDNAISPEEEKQYLASQVKILAQGITLTASGTPLPLQETGATLHLNPGAGGLETLKIAIDWQARLPVGTQQAIAYRDNNYPTRAGWKEIVVLNGAGGLTHDGSVSDVDQSHELTVYPASVIPPQVTEAHFSLTPGATAPIGNATPVLRPAENAAPTPHDAFTQAIAHRQLTPGLLITGLLLAFGFGAIHALSPGHGKAMVAAYLVGSRGTPRHAVLLGIIVTITHTLGVFALGLITLFASRYIVPEKLYPVLSVVSGLSVFGVGVWLLATRSRGLAHEHDHAHDHGHSHDHEHPHSHDHVHSHSHDEPSHTHDHAPPHTHVHEDGTVHTHTHDEDAAHSHDHAHEHPHTHSHDHEHAHNGHVHYHSHGFGGHSHSHDLPEGPVTAKALLALGVSGGIVPCPSALVVLLSAVALHRIAYGMALITAFSFGLAAVLVAIGLAVVMARGLLDKVPSGGAIMNRLPVASAAAITIIGLVLVVQALH